MSLPLPPRLTALPASPTTPNEQGLATVDTFLTTAVLRIMNNAALPIHAVNRAFEQTFRLPFRAFRQPSLQVLTAQDMHRITARQLLRSHSAGSHYSLSLTYDLPQDSPARPRPHCSLPPCAHPKHV